MLNLPRSKLLLIIILCAGFWLRIHQLDTLPMGLFYDEALNARDSSRLIHYGNPQIFYPENNGREPLHIYWQAVTIAAVGQTAWGARLATVFVGLISVAITYPLARELFYDRKERDQLAVVSTIVVAIGYWSIALSRLVFRSMYMVPITGLAIFFLSRARRSGRYRDFALSGLFLGLSLYTYLSARIFPLVFILFVLFELARLGYRDRFTWQSTLLSPAGKGYMLAALVSILIFSPLGYYFAQNPDVFFDRLGDVDLYTQEVDTQIGPIFKTTIQFAETLGLFFWRGDIIERHNIPNQPAFGVLFGLLFLVGFIFVWIKSFSNRHLLLIWFLVLMAPAALSDDPVLFLRAVGLMLPAAFITSFGFHQLWQWGKSISAVNGATLWLGLLLIVTSVEFVQTYTLYFVTWPQTDRLYDHFFADFWQGAELTQKQLKNHITYLTPDMVTQPNASVVFDYALMESYIRRFDANRSCFVYQETAAQSLAYVTSVRTDGEIKQKVESFYQHSEQGDVTLYPANGDVLFDTTIIPQGVSIVPPTVEQSTNFGNLIHFGGYNLIDTTDTQKIDLSLYFDALQPPDNQYIFFVHLYDMNDTNTVLAQIDLEFCHPSFLWHTGEGVAQDISFTIPEGLGAGEYGLGLGVYLWPSFERLPIVPNAAHPAIDLGDGRLLFHRFNIE